MSNTEILIEGRRLASIIAPELKALNLIDANEVGAPTGRCLAWASNFVNFDVKNRMGSEWVDGPTIAMDFPSIAKCCTEADSFKAACLATVVHEVGHVVPAQAPIDLAGLEPTPQFLNWQREIAETDLTGNIEPLGRDSAHGPRFIRRVCHLWCRAAAAAGYDLPTGRLLSWPAKFEFYLPLLAGEILRMRDATFAEIEAEAMPPALLDQFERDCNFQNQIRKGKQK